MSRRRRRREAERENDGDKEEEEDVDIYHTVFIDTNLDTHFAVAVSDFDTVSDLKKKVMLEHVQCYPDVGEISIHALKVKRKGHFYRLSDSMCVSRAFEGVKKNWFLSVDASCMKQLSENSESRRPNMCNQLPLLCLTYNPLNAEINTDDAPTSANIKSALTEGLRNKKVQLILGDSCGDCSEDLVTERKGNNTEIFINAPADSDRVSSIQYSKSIEYSPAIELPGANKKQKIKKHNVNEGGDHPARVNISVNNASDGDALGPEVLFSANMLVHAKKAKCKGGYALEEYNGFVGTFTEMAYEQKIVFPEDNQNSQIIAYEQKIVFPEDNQNSQIIASNTLAPEPIDKDHSRTNLGINVEKSKKRKRNKMNLSNASNLVTGEVLSPPENGVSVNLLANSERNEHEVICGDPSNKKVSVFTSTIDTGKEEIELPEKSRETHDSHEIVLDTLPSEPADSQHLKSSPGVKDKRSKKKRKKDANFNPSAATVLPSSNRDAEGEEDFKEKVIALKHASGEEESCHEPVPIETVKEKGGLPSKSLEEKHNSHEIVLDTLEFEPADNQHLKISPGIKDKRGKKKRKKEKNFNSSTAIVLPSTNHDAEGAENFKEKDIASKHVSGEEELCHEVVTANLVLNTERTKHEELRGDSSKEDKVSASTANKASKQEIGLTEKSITDQHNSQTVVPGILPDNKPLTTNLSFKSKRSKKRSKRDAASESSSAVVLPGQDAGEDDSLKEKNIASEHVSGEDASRREGSISANLVVHTERTEREEIREGSFKEEKVSVSTPNKASKQEIGLTGTSIEGQHNSQKVACDTLSSETANKEHLSTGPGIKSRKIKKQRKTDVISNISSSVILPSSVEDAGDVEIFNVKNIASNHVSGEDETSPMGVIAKLTVNKEKTEHKEIRGLLEQGKYSLSSSKKTSIQETGMIGNSVEDPHNSQTVVLDSSPPELADSELLRTTSNTKIRKSKKKSKRDATSNSSSAGVLPSSVQDNGKESFKGKNNASKHVSVEDESCHEDVVPANLMVNTERSEHKKFSGDQDKGFHSVLGKKSTQEIGLTGNSVQDHDNIQKVVPGSLSPKNTDVEQSSTKSSIKKKKKKTKMDETLNASNAIVLPPSVQDDGEEESLREKKIHLHDDESHPEVVTNLLVNVERPENEEITRDPTEKNNIALNATCAVEMKLDGNTQQISKDVNSVDGQSTNTMKNKSRKRHNNPDTQNPPVVAESGGDVIDFRHYFLHGKAKDKVTGSDKNVENRSERDKTKIVNASLETSLDLQSNENHEGGFSSHIRNSNDIDPQESFTKNASRKSSFPSKKSTSDIYEDGFGTSNDPDQTNTPYPVPMSIVAGLSVKSTPAPAFIKGNKVSLAASSSSSSSKVVGKPHHSKKSNNHVSNTARTKASASGTKKVASSLLPKKSLLTTPGSIFKDDSSESSDDEEKTEQLDASTSTPSDDASSSDSDSESDTSLHKPRKGSSGLERSEGRGNVEKPRSSNSKPMSINEILRSSSRFKKAKLAAESQPGDSEGQPIDFVPDSQAIL